MNELFLFIPEEFYLPAVVIVGLLLIVGVISRRKAMQFLGALIFFILLAPFVVSFVSQMSPWAQVLVLVIGAVWIGGVVVRLIAGKHVQGELAARFIEEMITWPFRAVYGALRFVIRHIFGDRGNRGNRGNPRP